MYALSIEHLTVQDDGTMSPGSGDFAGFKEHSRREHPLLVRQVLEQAVDEEAQTIEKNLKQQLVDIIRDCQEQIFLSYRERMFMNGQSLMLETTEVEERTFRGEPRGSNWHPQ
jgi:hypothetical protein